MKAETFRADKKKKKKRAEALKFLKSAIFNRQKCAIHQINRHKNRVSFYIMIYIQKIKGKHIKAEKQIFKFSRRLDLLNIV